MPGLALGGAVAAATAVVLTLVLAGGPTGPTVADAARLASQPPTGPAPGRLDDSKAKLNARVENVVFPDFGRMYGWHATGVRKDQVQGRDAKVVYYEKKGDRIGYVITAGSALPQPSGAKTVKRWGVPYDKLTVDGKPAVTWERLGHTCILTGASSPSELVKLASWRGGGDAPLLALALESSREPVAGSKEAARQGALWHLERASRLVVGEAGDVDRDNGIAKLLGKLRDRVVDLTGFGCNGRIVLRP